MTADMIMLEWHRHAEWPRCILPPMSPCIPEQERAENEENEANGDLTLGVLYYMKLGHWPHPSVGLAEARLLEEMKSDDERCDQQNDVGPLGESTIH